jgi:hypothetical protein
VLFVPEKEFISCKIIPSFSRISNFFGGIDGSSLMENLFQFELLIKKIGENFSNYKSISDLKVITESILAPNGSALYLTEVNRGIHFDPTSALNSVFESLVGKYIPEFNNGNHTDHYTWKNAYKEYFDKYDITRKLEKHAIETKKDKLIFDKAWENGIWNCYQTLAFDLKQEEDIKSKVYTWSGILKELETAKEHLNLYLLTTTPTEEHKYLKPFIKEMLSVNKDNIKVTVVEEKEAEEFAAQLKIKMDKSGRF